MPLVEFYKDDAYNRMYTQFPNVTATIMHSDNTDEAKLKDLYEFYESISHGSVMALELLIRDGLKINIGDGL